MNRAVINRKNASFSTGPKTLAGKRRASVNATRHGLSVRLTHQDVKQNYPGLVGLIVDEGFSYSNTIDLAMKIIDYERNQMDQVKQFIEADVGRFSESLKDETVCHEMAQWAAMCGGYDRVTKEAIERYVPPRLDGLGAQAGGKVFQRQLAMLAKMQNRLDKRSFQSTSRYYKRASNQLIATMRRHLLAGGEY